MWQNRQTFTTRWNDAAEKPRTPPPKNEILPPVVLAPPYRHAAPSGPWPWMDLSKIHSDETEPTCVIVEPEPTTQPTSSIIVKSKGSDHTTQIPSVESEGYEHTAGVSGPRRGWRGYPKSHFGNWGKEQVDHSGMLTKCSKTGPSSIYWMDVLDDGRFCSSNIGEGSKTTKKVNENGFWSMLETLETLKERKDIRVQSLCVDNLTEPVLKMLGGSFNIEPFFFTSSINRIPSRYQEALVHGKGDHITITLPFVRTLYQSRTSTPSQTLNHASSHTPGDSKINTQAPFPLHNGNILFIDLLAIHMVRDVGKSTIISYHAESTRQTPAKHLHSLMLLVGRSVYWNNMFTKSTDPTLLLLAILWYALYAWDESFELLYDHITWLESEVLIESRVEHTRDLHILKAHLLHYESLLHDFMVSVEFIEKTPNPAMENRPASPAMEGRPVSPAMEDRPDDSKEMVKLECQYLLSEIKRLHNRRSMMSDRLKNVMDLALANVNIRESASMRQVTYLTMIFLPASLIASVFGMNVSEINPGSLGTLARYAEVTIALTLLTFYIVITVTTHTSFHERGASWRQRAAWPILFPWRWVQEGIRLIPFFWRWVQKGIRLIPFLWIWVQKKIRGTDTSDGMELNEKAD